MQHPAKVYTCDEQVSGFDSHGLRQNLKVVATRILEVTGRTYPTQLIDFHLSFVSVSKRKTRCEYSSKVHAVLKGSGFDARPCR